LRGVSPTINFSFSTSFGVMAGKYFWPLDEGRGVPGAGKRLLAGTQLLAGLDSLPRGWGGICLKTGPAGERPCVRKSYPWLWHTIVTPSSSQRPMSVEVEHTYRLVRPREGPPSPSTFVNPLLETGRASSSEVMATEFLYGHSELRKNPRALCL